jgi:phage terminase small subunit
MGARGRKSKAELSTISYDGLEIHRRPDPPDHMGDDAAEIWRAITNSLPADWFSPGTLPLLEALCGLTVSQRYTLRAVQGVERDGQDFDGDSWVNLLRQMGEISGRIATLATRLRLTPQSRYGARSADTAARNAGDGPKPREFTGRDDGD